MWIDSKKHSSFSTTFPIYIYERKSEEVPDVPEEEELAAAEAAATKEAARLEKENGSSFADENDDITVEYTPGPGEDAEEKAPVSMKTITTEQWIHLNDVAPLWQRCVSVIFSLRLQFLSSFIFADNGHMAIFSLMKRSEERYEGRIQRVLSRAVQRPQ
jgi:heat shock protein beta